MNNQQNYKPSNSSDELNPIYLFRLTHTELLTAIANGIIDAKEVAKQELKMRGLDLNGNWIGFN